jgi:hypothetical protein
MHAQDLDSKTVVIPSARNATMYMLQKNKASLKDKETS